MPRFCSIFSQLLQCFPRAEFQRAVTQTKAERHARGFTCWGQFVAMMFYQLAGADSLREIVYGLRSCEGKLTHLGITAPARSTLSYANAHRPWVLYQQVFYQMLDRCRTVVPGRKRFRFKNRLVSMDASVIELCATVFAWAKFRRTKGAVKLHCQLDHAGYLPTVVVITDGKQHDLVVARQQRFDAGTILVMDRGYIDYAWLASLDAAGVFFVTRLKDNTAYEVVERHPVPARGNVLADEWIVLTGPQTRHKYESGRPLRRVEIWLPQEERTLVFITNHLDLGATTVARIYKDRWQIELFFKALKQNLRVKTFVGTSANALHIQVWTALIALLVLKYLQFKAHISWSFSNLSALLRMNLFVYRDLWAWLDTPYTAPPPPSLPEQGLLTFA